MSTIKEKLQAIKAIFNTTPPAGFVAPVAPVVEPVKAEDEGAMAAMPVGYAVDGGVPIYTDISDDSIPGLDANDYVFTDEAMTTPYPDGTYNITGTDFGFTVTGSQIAIITNPSGSGAGQPIADLDAPVMPVTTPIDAAKPVAPVAPAVTPEAMKALMNKFAIGTPEERITNLEAMCKALMESSFGWQMREAEMKQSQDAAMQAYNTLNAQFAKQENFSKQVLELVEMVANQPTASPVTVLEAKKESFNSKKEAQLEKMAKAIAEAKKTKAIS